MCPTHGGSAPQVRAAAQARLLTAADPAVAVLVELLTSPEERVRLQAAKAVLDRVNLDGPGDDVVVWSAEEEAMLDSSVRQLIANMEDRIPADASGD